MELESRSDEGLADTPVEPGRVRAISLERAAEVSREIRDLISAGHERRAWELLRTLHPADMGSIVAGLPRSSREAMLRIMSPETVAWMFRQMNPAVAARIGTRIGAGMMSTILRQLRPQLALETLRRLPTLRVRPRLALETLRRLPTPTLRIRRESGSAESQLEDTLDESEPLAHSLDEAGAIMTASFPSVGRSELVESARANLRALEEDRERFSHVLVLDDGGELFGQISMVDLALSENDTPVADIAETVVATVNMDTPVEECARLQRHYNLTYLPVEEGGRVIGVIPSESLLSATVEEDTRQMMQVASVAGEVIDGPLMTSIRTRLPWLTVNLGTTFLAAATVSLFEPTLTQVVVLAAFLPVVAGQGGIGGTQTLTLIVRSIALGELVGVGATRILVREAALGILHGVWLGILVAVVAIIWKQNLGLGLVLGVAMFGNMIIAGSVGAAIPLLLRRMGVDPAVASAVIVTTITDVFGFLLFLGIASAAISLIQ